MCSAPAPAPAHGDLTAKARIRQAAIGRFARQGFGVPVRAIAEEAGVSPALVIHHFGSKEGLRRACDQQILDIVVESKQGILASGGQNGVAALGAAMADLHRFADVPGYMLRSLQAGGALAKALIETYIGAARDVLEAGVAAGTMKPSRDPEARARSMVLQSLGALVAYAALTGDQFDTPDAIVRYVADISPPLLELYTEGLFTDGALLAAYLRSTEPEEAT